MSCTRSWEFASRAMLKYVIMTQVQNKRYFKEHVVYVELGYHNNNNNVFPELLNEWIEWKV